MTSERTAQDPAQTHPFRSCCGVHDRRPAIPGVCPTCGLPGHLAVLARRDHFTSRGELHELRRPGVALKVVLPAFGSLLLLQVGAFIYVVWSDFRLLPLLFALGLYVALSASLDLASAARLRSLAERAAASSGMVCTRCLHPMGTERDGTHTCPECGWVALVADTVRSWEVVRLQGQAVRPFAWLRWLAARLRGGSA